MYIYIYIYTHTHTPVHLIQTTVWQAEGFKARMALIDDAEEITRVLSAGGIGAIARNGSSGSAARNGSNNLSAAADVASVGRLSRITSAAESSRVATADLGAAEVHPSSLLRCCPLSLHDPLEEGC